MKRIDFKRLLLPVLMLAGGYLSAVQASTEVAPPAVVGELLVGMRAGGNAGQLAQIVGSEGTVQGGQDVIRAYRVRVGGRSGMANAANRLRKHAAVAYVEVNNLVQAVGTPSDPQWGNQYGPKKIQVDRAWDYFEPQAQQIVAVVDSGIEYTHPDLSSLLLRDANGQVVGYNALNRSSNANDDQGHGTHCAGTIAARINNGEGVAGVAGWNPLVAGSDDYIRLMPVKVLDSAGNGSDASVADGVIWAANRGARIISLSLGSAGASTTMNNAIQYAWGKGCIIVAAAGNNGISTTFYPAGFSNVISVGATDSSDTLASFSNYGYWVKTAAPGVSIVSTYRGGGYAAMSGTSMAAPHVAGLAALLRAHAPALTNAQINSLIIGNTDAYHPYSGRTLASGAGRVNALRALLAAGGGGTVTAPAAPTGVQAAAGNARVTLSWNGVSGAAGYTVKRSTTSGYGYVTLSSSLTTATYTDTLAANGTTYYYTVTATNAGGESAASAQVSATPSAPAATAPAAPTGLQAAAGNAQVTLSWTASTGATSYTVKRSTTSGYGYAAVASGQTGTSYTDATVANGTAYYYVVTASNSGGESAASAQVAATPAAPSAQGLRINAGGTAYAAASTTFGADQYAAGGSPWTYTTRDIVNTTDDSLYLNVRYGTSFSYALPAAAGAYTLRLHFAECYFWAGGRVFNVDVNGSRVLTNFDIVTAAGGLNRSIVKEFAVTSTGSVINVAFNRVVDNALLSAIELIPAAGTDSPAPAAPAAPASLQATSGNAQVSLSWAASADATTYTVKRSTTSGSGYAAVTNVSDTSYTDTGVSNGTPYYYVVTATNAGGESAASAQAAATPVAPLPAAPGAPTGLLASAGNGQVALSWTAAAGATSYTVKRSTTSGAGYTAIATGLTGTSYANTGLTNGTTYYYVVTASNT
ncbi:MAG: hypothetical protein K0Q72_3468, partial [Armatimonadetes bacterium]|nr:hypothetical protein [Armatimonadota bacterium]